MVFNKTGEIQRNLTFHVANEILEVTNRYKYLGTLMSSSGSYNPVIEQLSEKASKAYFSVRNVLQKVYFDTNITLKCFDTALQPILTYNSEIWSQLNPRQFKAMKTLSHPNEHIKFIFESLLKETENQHLKICKGIHTLVVNRSCSNLGVLGKLGRMPMIIHCLQKQFLFFIRCLKHLRTRTIFVLILIIS